MEIYISPSNDTREYDVKLRVFFSNAVKYLFHNGVLGAHILKLLESNFFSHCRLEFV